MPPLRPLACCALALVLAGPVPAQAPDALAHASLSSAVDARVSVAPAPVRPEAGARDLFYEDYTSDPLGAFPASLEYVDGTWETAEWQGRRLLRTTGPRNAAFRIPLPEALPEAFTVETEVFFPRRNQRLILMTEPVVPREWSRTGGHHVQVASGNGGTGVRAHGGTGLPSSLSRPPALLHEGPVTLRIEVEGRRAQVFVGDTRTANLPVAAFPRTSTLHVQHVSVADAEHPVYLGPIRVTAPGAAPASGAASPGDAVPRPDVGLDTPLPTVALAPPPEALAGQPLSALARSLTVQRDGAPRPMVLVAARIEGDRVVERFTSEPFFSDGRYLPSERYLPDERYLPGSRFSAGDRFVRGDELGAEGTFVINGVFPFDFALPAVQAARRSAAKPGADAILMMLVPAEEAWADAEGMRSTPLVVLLDERR